MFFMYIVLSIITLCVFITGHEWGHFIAAKSFGCTVHEFSIGFGPQIIQKTCKDGMKFTLRLIPLGGFCQIAGEGGNEKNGDAGKLLCNKKPWQQVIVFLAGIAVNILLGFIFCIIGFLTYGFPIGAAIESGFETFLSHLALIFESFKLLFSGNVGIEQVSGVVGCVNEISQISASAQTISLGLANFFVLMGFVSTNLGIVNALPVPALDGGRAFLLLLNKISQIVRHKPLSEKAQQKAITYTIMLAFCLMGVFVVKDLIFIIWPR